MTTDPAFNVTMTSMQEHGFFWVTFEGEIDMAILKENHARFLDHSDFSPNVDELLDFSRSSIKRLSRRGIELIREYMTARTERHDCKSAIVVSTELEYGLGRMMGLHLDEIPVDRNVFLSIGDALEWLRPGQSAELIALYDRLSPPGRG